MKKFHLLCIGILSMSTFYAQDITDALRYSQSEIQGTARFRALSGAFGALGGDMSAVNLNPAGAAVFSQSHASFSLSNTETNNDTQYYNGFNTTTNSDFDINQAGASFVFANNNPASPWRKFTIGVAYDKINSFDNAWNAAGTNTNVGDIFDLNGNPRAPQNSIAGYFYLYSEGVRLEELRSYGTISEDYSYLGNDVNLGFGAQQAYLGYQSYIIEPDIDDNNNIDYFSQVERGNFTHDYSYSATGLNGKIAFNMAAQYGDNLYLGLNLNSHFINYDRSTYLIENNNNGSVVNYIEFGNTLSTSGNGFSFQLGAILKLSDEFRAGLAYDSPTWYNIAEETTQFLFTNGDNGQITINPQTVNIYPEYRLQTPAKVTGSLAYIFGTQGLISFDYSRKNYGSAKFKPTSDPYFEDENDFMSNVLTTASTYRMGAEYKANQFSFRGGYRFEESPYENGVTVGDLTGFSLGLGYNFGNTKLDLTYDQSNRSFETPLYNVGLTDAATIDNTNSNITLSLSFNI